MTTAIIPARGGSKRIPGKNIRPFSGVPILARCIEIARSSGCFDTIIVSTDDADVEAVAKSAGADVPFRRPDALATDTATTTDVMAHAVETLEGLGHASHHYCCIYPTAVLIRPQDLCDGLALLESSKASYVIPVTDFDYPIQRALTLSGGRLKMMDSSYQWSRTQDLPEAWHDAGQFYWATRETFLAREPAFSGGAAPLKLPRHRVVDIDTESDWLIAEALFKILAAAEA